MQCGKERLLLSLQIPSRDYLGPLRLRHFLVAHILYMLSSSVCIDLR
jgi:hypothetical protein